MEGQFFQDRYDIIDKIGQGGMARVYRAFDRKMQRHVAIKILREELVQDATFVERFRQEALAIASLSHPNVVSVYDHGSTGESYFIVMEYVAGRDLKSYLRQKKVLSPSEAVSLARQICAGVQAAHQKGLIHRDIKPQNILLAEDGRVKVVDFGIARAMNAVGLTTTGVAFGSVQYISPEQARGDKVLPSSDAYSIGVVLFEMLTGRLPFDGATAVEVALKHIQERPPRLAEVAPTLPAALDALVARALEKDPSRRFANAAEMRGALVEADRGAAEGTTRLVPMPANAECGTRNAERDADTDETTDEIGATTVWSMGDEDFWARAGRNEQSAPLDVPAPAQTGRGKLLSGLAWSAVAVVLLMAVGYGVVRAWPMFQKSGWLSSLSGTTVGLIRTPTPTLSPTPSPTSAPQSTPVPSATRVEVPGVLGLDLSAAQDKARRAGLQLVVGGSRADQRAPVNAVVEQHPSQGERVATGDRLVVVISTGPGAAPSPQLVQVPELLGRTSKEADDSLRNAGLTVGSSSTRLSADVPTGRVMEQSPPANAPVARGSRVDVVISGGAPTSVPASPTPVPSSTPRPATPTAVVPTPTLPSPTPAVPTATPAVPTATPAVPTPVVPTPTSVVPAPTSDVPTPAPSPGPSTSPATQTSDEQAMVLPDVSNDQLRSSTLKGAAWLSRQLTGAPGTP